MIPIPKATKPPKIPKETRPKPIVLAIDFNGVLENPQDIPEGKRWGNPMPGAIEAMEQLYDKGFRLIVHTCPAHTPAGWQAVVDWLDYYKVPYHEVTAVKPVANLYIDDKALKFIDWNQTLGEIYG